LNTFRQRVRKIIKPFFDKYDANRSKSIDEYELQKVLDDIGLKQKYVNPYYAKIIMLFFDEDNSGELS
jgi:hypothetical protein